MASVLGQATRWPSNAKRHRGLHRALAESQAPEGGSEVMAVVGQKGLTGAALQREITEAPLVRKVAELDAIDAYQRTFLGAKR